MTAARRRGATARRAAAAWPGPRGPRCAAGARGALCAASAGGARPAAAPAPAARARGRPPPALAVGAPAGRGRPSRHPATLPPATRRIAAPFERGRGPSTWAHAAQPAAPRGPMCQRPMRAGAGAAHGPGCKAEGAARALGEGGRGIVARLGCSSWWAGRALPPVSRPPPPGVAWPCRPPPPAPHPLQASAPDLGHGRRSAASGRPPRAPQHFTLLRPAARWRHRAFTQSRAAPRPQLNPRVAWQQRTWRDACPQDKPRHRENALFEPRGRDASHHPLTPSHGDG
jgi:hypothetical protein